jgi:hypothetical protein
MGPGPICCRVSPEQPRENGTAAIHETAAWLVETLQGMGPTSAPVVYTAHPYRLRLAGVLAFVGAVLYAWSLRGRRPLLALLVAVGMPALLLLELDRYVPIVSWIGATPQHHVVARLPAEQPTQRLILSAHYDTKTDLLDHVARAPIELLGLPVTALMIVAAVWAARRRYRAGPLPLVARIAGWTAVVYGLGLFASLTAGCRASAQSRRARRRRRLRGAHPPRRAPEGRRPAAAHRGRDRLALRRGDRRARLVGVRAPAVSPTRPTSDGGGEPRVHRAASDLRPFGSGSSLCARSLPDPALLALLDGVHHQRGRSPST